jgi:hypothetical protein
MGRRVGGNGGPFCYLGRAKIHEKTHKALMSQRQVMKSSCNVLEVSRTMQLSVANPNPMEKSMDSVVVVENAGGGSPLLSPSVDVFLAC